MCPRFRVPGPDFRLYVIDINLFMRLILCIDVICKIEVNSSFEKFNNRDSSNYVIYIVTSSIFILKTVSMFK